MVCVPANKGATCKWTLSLVGKVGILTPFCTHVRTLKGSKVHLQRFMYDDARVRSCPYAHARAYRVCARGERTSTKQHIFDGACPRIKKMSGTSGKSMSPYTKTESNS